MRKYLAMLLAAVMLLTMMPLGAAATETDTSERDELIALASEFFPEYANQICEERIGTYAVSRGLGQRELVVTESRSVSDTEGYHLADADGFIETLDASAHIPNLSVMLQRDGETLLTMDWTDVYGELPSGEYLVGIHVYDKFTESQVHPLMTDYHDWQVYDFVVEIP